MRRKPRELALGATTKKCQKTTGYMRSTMAGCFSENAAKKGLESLVSSPFAHFLAEEVGFEPTVPCGTTVFKTAALDHSATPPHETAILEDEVC